MRLKKALMVLGVAGVTMAATLLFLTPPSGNHALAAPTIKPVIAQPQFKSQGCIFVLKTDKPVYEAGEAPVLEVTASNPTDQPVQAKVWVTLFATAPTSPLSRMVAVPRALWVRECVVHLQPGETKKVTLHSDARLPAKQDISIALSDKKETILAGKPRVTNSLASGPISSPAVNSLSPKP
jgi:hypothetical protein